MSPLRTVFGLFWRTQRRRFLAGLAMAVATVLAGVALLGLSGWFIAACATAGAAGVGIGFDFFRPSAAVRFLALVRTAARYGERLTLHDATLGTIAGLRHHLFLGLVRQPLARIARLRRGTVLHRLTTDLDTLDTLYLRLIVPVTSAALVLGAAGCLLAWLVHPWVAAWVVAVTVVGGVGTFLAGARLGGGPARRHMLALEALRLRGVDLLSGALDLAMAGRLADQRDRIALADRYLAAASWALDRVEIRLAAIVHLVTMAAAAGVLVIGAAAEVSVERTALGVFAAMALGEALTPLLRGALDLRRLHLAAGRVVPLLPPAPSPTSVVSQQGELHPELSFDRLSLRRGGTPLFGALSLTLVPGEWVAVCGASGTGKTSLLLAAAGLMAPSAGTVRVGGVDVNAVPEPTLRRVLALLPQRSELFAATIGDNLRLAAPDADDDTLRDVLETVCLWDVLAPRGGLGLRLGDGGSGLSGGEVRRLALARLLLRRSRIVLLDEPTEGLDPALADRVLANLRLVLADAVVLTASHRTEEVAVADRVIDLPPLNPTLKV